MKRTIWATIGVVVLAGLVALPLMAQQPQGRGMGQGTGRQAMGRGMGPGGPGGPMALLRGVQLTDAQRDQIRAIMEEHREDMPADRVRDLDKQLQLAVLADAPDMQKIEALKTEIAARAAEALAMRIDVETRIVQILTPAQRAQARENIGRMGPPPGRGR